jgi:hypothetical protein
MSNLEQENQSDAPTIGAELQNGANNSKGAKMSVNDLLSLNVNLHTEKKNNLTYLSWAWAWAEALKADPAASFSVQTFDNKAYMDVNGTAMVWVAVTLFGKQLTCMLPVMDYRNKPIPAPDAFAVNTAIMRCLTKGLALHGLGLYIYAGEDMPQESSDKPEAAVDTEPSKPKAIDPTPQQKVAEIIQKAVDTVESGGSSELARMQAFAEGMQMYVEMSDTKDALVSYWKANQTQLDALKKDYDVLYKEVLKKFQAAKSTLKEKEDGKV